MTVREAAERVAQVQHELTTTGGARPLGCTALVLGMDSDVGIDNTSPRLFRMDPGGTLEDCWYCCAGKDQDRSMAVLGEHYDDIRTSDTVTAIQKLLSLRQQLAGHADESEISYDLWVIRPRAGRRGKSQVTCFMDVGSAGSLGIITAHFMPS